MVRPSFVPPAVLLLALAIGGAARAQTAASVAPGSLVRWPGAGATRCFLGERALPPFPGGCLFPIDLFRAPGPLTVSREKEGRRESLSLDVSPSPYPVERLTLEDRFVRPTKKDLARAERDRKQLERVFSRRTPPRFTLPFARPLAGAPPARNFGRKRILNGEERQPHAGADYPVPSGTEVLAVEDGVVALTARHFFAGRVVVVDHGGGFFSTYAHLDAFLAKEGALVRRGDPIAKSGATGRVNGPHLHFGVRWQGARIDPELLFRAPEGLPTVGEP